MSEKWEVVIVILGALALAFVTNIFLVLPLP